LGVNSLMGDLPTRWPTPWRYTRASALVTSRAAFMREKWDN
jgi:hypothetical protein